MDSFYLSRGTQNPPNLQVVTTNPGGYLDKFHRLWSYSYHVLRIPLAIYKPLRRRA